MSASTEDRLPQAVQTPKPANEEPLILEHRGAVPRPTRLFWAVTTLLLWIAFLYLLVPPAREAMDALRAMLDGLPMLAESVGHVLAELSATPGRVASGSMMLLASGATLHRATRGEQQDEQHAANRNAFVDPAFDDTQMKQIRQTQRVVAHHDPRGRVIAITLLGDGVAATEPFAPDVLAISNGNDALDADPPIARQRATNSPIVTLETQLLKVASSSDSRSFDTHECSFASSRQLPNRERTRTHTRDSARPFALARAPPDVEAHCANPLNAVRTYSPANAARLFDGRTLIAEGYPCASNG